MRNNPAGDDHPAGEYTNGDFKVVWPRSRQAIDPQALAVRPATLDGATVAFLWDYLFRGDEIFPVIAEELQARYDDVTIIDYPEFGSTHGAREGEIVAGLGRRLRQLGVDAVVSGMAC
ncbi:MAG: hypothetical protein OEV40_22925 [Acidimicrobiia bacterium]|nr:hypothetical protein [Acidimicrobiia bacterium]